MKITTSKPPKLIGKNLRIAIIISRFNDSLGNILLKNTQEHLLKNGVLSKNILTTKVPGALELPLAAKILAKTEKYDAIIALGIVIKGETSHYDIVSNESHHGLMQATLETEIPIIFGVITALNLKQAVDRVEKDKLNKGREFAESAIEMANFKFSI